MLFPDALGTKKSVLGTRQSFVCGARHFPVATLVKLTAVVVTLVKLVWLNRLNASPLSCSLKRSWMGMSLEMRKSTVRRVVGAVNVLRPVYGTRPPVKVPKLLISPHVTPKSAAFPQGEPLTKPVTGFADAIVTIPPNAKPFSRRREGLLEILLNGGT